MVSKVYFLYNGVGGFVIQAECEVDDVVYATVEKGDFIGLIDLFPNKKEIKDGKIGPARRKFTLKCLSDWCEFLTLSIKDFSGIKADFPLVFDELFVNSMS